MKDASNSMTNKLSNNTIAVFICMVSIWGRKMGIIRKKLIINPYVNHVCMHVTEPPDKKKQLKFTAPMLLLNPKYKKQRTTAYGEGGGEENALLDCFANFLILHSWRTYWDCLVETFFSYLKQYFKIKSCKHIAIIQEYLHKFKNLFFTQSHAIDNLPEEVLIQDVPLQIYSFRSGRKNFPWFINFHATNKYQWISWNYSYKNKQRKSKSTKTGATETSFLSLLSMTSQWTTLLDEHQILRDGIWKILATEGKQSYIHGLLICK